MRISDWSSDVCSSDLAIMMATSCTETQLVQDEVAIMHTKLPTPKIGISACLLGNPVRFNGGHKESRLCSETLAQQLEFVPVCPEVATGLGTPRPGQRSDGKELDSTCK